MTEIRTQDGSGVEPRINGMAVASMVLGIMWLFWIGSILAVVLGHTSIRSIRRSEGRQKGQGMAVAGVTLGWIGVGFALLAVVLMITGYGDDEASGVSLILR